MTTVMATAAKAGWDWTNPSYSGSEWVADLGRTLVEHGDQGKRDRLTRWAAHRTGFRAMTRSLPFVFMLSLGCTTVTSSPMWVGGVLAEGAPQRFAAEERRPAAIALVASALAVMGPDDSASASKGHAGKDNAEYSSPSETPMLLGATTSVPEAPGTAPAIARAEPAIKGHH